MDSKSKLPSLLLQARNMSCNRARRARARARRSQPGEECEGNLKIFLMSIGQSTLPDLYPIVNFSPNYKMWSK